MKYFIRTVIVAYAALRVTGQSLATLDSLPSCAVSAVSAYQPTSLTDGTETLRQYSTPPMQFRCPVHMLRQGLHQ